MTTKSRTDAEIRLTATVSHASDTWRDELRADSGPARSRAHFENAAEQFATMYDPSAPARSQACLAYLALGEFAILDLDITLAVDWFSRAAVAAPDPRTTSRARRRLSMCRRLVDDVDEAGQHLDLARHSLQAIPGDDIYIQLELAWVEFEQAQLRQARRQPTEAKEIHLRALHSALALARKMSADRSFDRAVSAEVDCLVSDSYFRLFALTDAEATSTANLGASARTDAKRAYPPPEAATRYRKFPLGWLGDDGGMAFRSQWWRAVGLLTENRLDTPFRLKQGIGTGQVPLRLREHLTDIREALSCYRYAGDLARRAKKQRLLADADAAHQKAVALVRAIATVADADAKDGRDGWSGLRELVPYLRLNDRF